MPAKPYWWQRGVVYQIYPRSFMDHSGDGVGDIQGVIDKLDYVEWLGVDAIWFSPLFPSPMADFGYDVSDYIAIHPDYGTLADFDRLLIEAHSRDLKVILDLVPNHTSDEHQWFVESRRSMDDPKRDWYIWKDPGPDGGPPNNWKSYFGGPAWTFDEATGQYYMHNFHPKQPELNWRNTEVEQAMFDVIRFWLRRGVDGFRIDVIDRLLKDPQFRDNPPHPDWSEGDNPTNALRRVHSEAQFPELFDLWRRFRRVFDEFPNKVAIGEVAYDYGPQQLAGFYGEERTDTDNENDGLHLPFNFGLIAQPWDAESIRAFVDTYDAALPSYAWPNYVLGNHDQSRIASKYGRAQARVAAVMLLTLRGTPTIYYGDELGMEDVTIPDERIQDPQGRDRNFNRDECRTPMQWDTSPHAGFCLADVTPWLPVADDYQQHNVAVQTDDPNAMLNLHQRLLNYRRRTPALHIGRYYAIDPCPAGCFVYLRQYNDQRCLIALNFTGETRTLDLSDYGDSTTIILSTEADRDGQPVDLGALALHGDEGVIIEV
jgi:alpha-glucosidase